MSKLQEAIEDGKTLAEEFTRLNDFIVNQRHLENNTDKDIRMSLKTLADDIKHFNADSDKFIDEAREFIDGRRIYYKNRQSKNVNELGMDSPQVADMYYYGKTIGQILNHLETMRVGASKKSRSLDGKFYYIPVEKIIYRNYEEMRIRSQKKKRESLCEVVFEVAPEVALSYDIEERRLKKYECDDEAEDPYEWIRRACDGLNQDAKNKFGIDYDLFERDTNGVYLNPKAYR